MLFRSFAVTRLFTRIFHSVCQIFPLVAISLVLCSRIQPCSFYSFRDFFLRTSSISPSGLGAQSAPSSSASFVSVSWWDKLFTVFFEREFMVNCRQTNRKSGREMLKSRSLYVENLYRHIYNFSKR